jgi:hypothetical protein
MMEIGSAQRTLRGQAYDILKRQLLAGELRPGERVNEVVMAARLGISRGPLREAIPSGDEAIIHETFARVFDSGTAVVLEAVSHGEGERVDVA